MNKTIEVSKINLAGDTVANENKTGTSFISKVLDIRFLSEHTYCLRLDRKKLDFKAGQLLNLGIPGVGVNREYSIYSGINDPFLDVLIREVKGGMVSVALKSLKPGDSVEIHGPYGEFSLNNPNDGRSYLFIATGTGIAPFHCFSQSFPNLNFKILHGVRQLNEQYDKSHYAPGRYISCVTKEPGGDFNGRVSDYLRKNKINSDIVSYLCGNRSMISETYDLLREQGVPSNNIFTEVFF